MIIGTSSLIILVTSYLESDMNMNKIDLTIATCVSNLESYQNCILDSIHHLRKHFNIQLLPIFNDNNIFSASIAGNIALESSKTRYLMYVHQDVSFTDSSGRKLYDALANKSDDVAIVGAAGVDATTTIDDIDKWRNNPGHEVGVVMNSIGEIVWDGCKNPKLVHTIDEMLIVLDRSTHIRFDPTIHGFHFYGFDICLQARSAGYDVMATDLSCKHHGEYSSSIYIDHGFINRFISMHKKWSKKFETVLSPYCHWYNNCLVSYLPFSIISGSDRIDILKFSLTLSDDKIVKHSLSASS